MTLARPRFSTTKLTEGYDCGEVDDFVDRVFVALSQDPPALTVEQVQGARFSPVRLREGYRMGDVDDWLDQVVVTLRADGDGVRADVAEAATTTGTTYAAEPTASNAIVRAEDRSTRVALAWGLAVVAVVIVLAALL